MLHFKVYEHSCDLCSNHCSVLVYFLFLFSLFFRVDFIFLSQAALLSDLNFYNFFIGSSLIVSWLSEEGTYGTVLSPYERILSDLLCPNPNLDMV